MHYVSSHDLTPKKCFLVNQKAFKNTSKLNFNSLLVVALLCQRMADNYDNYAVFLSGNAIKQIFDLTCNRCE